MYTLARALVITISFAAALSGIAHPIPAAFVILCCLIPSKSKKKSPTFDCFDKLSEVQRMENLTDHEKRAVSRHLIAELKNEQK